jgi:hypothetical protein
MLHKEIFGLAILGFIVWAFATSSSNERIERVCKPVAWGGNIATSVAALTTAKYQENVNNLFGKVNYGCQYTVWRLFYQKEYNAYQEQLQLQQGGAQVAAPTSSATSGDKK